MNNSNPPPVIDFARLLAYAINDDQVTYTDKLNLYVNSKRIGEVSALVICESMDDSKQILLFFCEADWEPVGTIALSTIEEAKQRAEIGYSGISSKWVSCEITTEEAEDYLEMDGGNGTDSAFAKAQCTFCKKHVDDVDNLYGNDEALICNECIDEFYKYVHEDN